MRTKQLISTALTATMVLTPFQSVWSKIAPPAVVWVGSTPEVAMTEWKAEGYHGDPLSSPHTEYVSNEIPVPDAYRKSGARWENVPGVLKTSEVSKWVTFFGAK